MAADMLVLSFHTFVFIVDAVSLIYEMVWIELGNHGFGGKFKFLTVWNIWLQTIYFGLCALKDFTEDEVPPSNPTRRSKLQRWRDTFHSTIAFPVGMFVVITFWVLYAIDRELVYPKYLDKVIPLWLNHMLHTAVLLFLFVDKKLVYHHHPKRHIGIIGACSLAMVYLAWIIFIAYYDNFWVYPVLEVLPAQERTVFISMCLAFFASFYILGESLTTFFWRHSPKSTGPRPKTK